MSPKLQQDIVKISGKTIFINPFLYWRRLDEKTNKWLRQPGQISEQRHRGGSRQAETVDQAG